MRLQDKGIEERQQ